MWHYRFILEIDMGVKDISQQLSTGVDVRINKHIEIYPEYEEIVRKCVILGSDMQVYPFLCHAVVGFEHYVWDDIDYAEPMENFIQHKYGISDTLAIDAANKVRFKILTEDAEVTKGYVLDLIEKAVKEGD